MLFIGKIAQKIKNSSLFTKFPIKNRVFLCILPRKALGWWLAALSHQNFPL
nr:MAG TPA: hypothetical protein [Caudoviricetes sp.]